MKSDQKRRAIQIIGAIKTRGSTVAVEPIISLLQELVDAPEAEPVARVTGYYAGYLSIATVDGRVLPAGTALYAAPTPAEAPADVARDAARYRWLKCERFDKPYAVTNENMTAVYEGDELDSAIDAARAAQKGGE